MKKKNTNGKKRNETEKFPRLLKIRAVLTQYFEVEDPSKMLVKTNATKNDVSKATYIEYQGL